jgi:hypothetical protein
MIDAFLKGYVLGSIAALWLVCCALIVLELLSKHDPLVLIAGLAGAGLLPELYLIVRKTS